MPDYATNLRRLMARDGLTVQRVVERTGLDERTIKSILSGTSKRPHAKTLHKLAAGLEVAVDELFQNPGTLTHKSFDRETNPLVDEVVNEQPELFEGWTESEFGELYSRFGTGGAMTKDGVVQAVKDMEEKRSVVEQVSILLESNHRELLKAMVDTLFRQTVLDESVHDGSPAETDHHDHSPDGEPT